MGLLGKVHFETSFPFCSALFSGCLSLLIIMGTDIGRIICIANSDWHLFWMLGHCCQCLCMFYFIYFFTQTLFCFWWHRLICPPEWPEFWGEVNTRLAVTTSLPAMHNLFILVIQSGYVCWSPAQCGRSWNSACLYVGAPRKVCVCCFSMSDLCISPYWGRGWVYLLVSTLWDGRLQRAQHEAGGRIRVPMLFHLWMYLCNKEYQIPWGTDSMFIIFMHLHITLFFQMFFEV